jgi:hypothetical protein
MNRAQMIDTLDTLKDLQTELNEYYDNNKHPLPIFLVITNDGELTFGLLNNSPTVMIYQKWIKETLTISSFAKWLEEHFDWEKE